MLNRILVAIDESYASECAFETGLRLSNALEAELVLVHVLDISTSNAHGNQLMSVDPFLFIQNEKKLKADSEKKMTGSASRYDTLLKKKQAEAEGMGIAVRYVQPYGRPGPAICTVAKENNVDLIVIGSRDRSMLKELAPGSVSNYVVHRAPCSVTVVHPDSHSKAKAIAQQSELALSGLL